MAMMEIRNVHKTFRTYAKAGLRPGAHKVVSELPVLQGVDLTVEKGDVVAILGPSGSGKTTLLRCLNFLETADAGQLVLDGETFDLAHAGRADIARLRKKTAFVFQNYNLFRNKTALQNVTEGLIVARRMPREQADAIGRRMLEKVGLADRADYYPRQLSGGQQQRVAIARALATDPEIIYFDEPTSALDPELTGEVLSVMRQLAEEGMTMLVVTHEMGFARNVSSKTVFMENGVVVEQAPSREFFAAPEGGAHPGLFAKDRPHGVIYGHRGASSSDTNTGCGSQRMRRPLSEPCILLAAVPTATPCFRRWRRSLPLQAIPSPALLPYGQQGPTPADGPRRNSPMAA